MKQVVVIHGGDAFSTYEEYLQFLKDFKIDDPTLPREKGWKAGLAEELGTGYQAIFPQMPSKLNAKYIEWKIWFEKYLPYINHGVVLVGHSLGGIFLVKYLAENQLPKSITATMLIAAPYNLGKSDSLETKDFALPNPLDLFAKQAGKTFLFHSEDDPVVPFSELAKYQAALPAATSRVFHDRQHFNQDSFPELIADIKLVS
jgi:predicted alpha/beta hydrolase family esterase